MEECQLSPEAQARLDQQMAEHQAYLQNVQKCKLELKLEFPSCSSCFDLEGEFAAA